MVKIMNFRFWTPKLSKLNLIYQILISWFQKDQEKTTEMKRSRRVHVALKKSHQKILIIRGDFAIHQKKFFLVEFENRGR